MRGLILRTACADDAAVALGLMRALAAYEGIEDQLPLTEPALRQMLCPPEPRLHVILAEWNGEAVGFVSYMIRYSAWMAREFISIDDLFVRTEARSLGVGRALMLEVGRLALEQEQIVRWEVQATNQRAVAFYHHLGASSTEKVICRWEPDAMRVALELTALTTPDGAA